MRTQEEINYYLQDTTIKNARNLLEIESCIKNNNLHLPNNVIIHENGISFAEFYKWFENRCFKAGDVLVSEYGNIVLFSHADKDNIVYYHCLMTPNRFSIELKCGIGKIHDCSLASESQKQRLFQKLYESGYTYNVITNSLEKIKKFDITTLKPFDKVLVRDTNGQVWTADLFSHIINKNPNLKITFVCVGHYPNQCIPYEGNKHLLGTSNDCVNFYKTWE